MWYMRKHMSIEVALDCNHTATASSALECSTSSYVSFIISSTSSDGKSRPTILDQLGCPQQSDLGRNAKLIATNSCLKGNEEQVAGVLLIPSPLYQAQE